MNYVFKVQAGYGGREAMAVLTHPNYTYEPREGADKIPIGDVPFCEGVLQSQGIAIQKPDFYPSWLKHWRLRSIVYNPEGSWFTPSRHTWFVKSTDSYKSVEPFILKSGQSLPSGNWVLSEVVNFVQEWRYYVSNGVVVTTGWYTGHDEDEPAPELAIRWPVNFCGAVDFGRLDDGEIALVESHHPYACGHYSDNHKLYAKWVVDGFYFMKKNFSEKSFEPDPSSSISIHQR